MTTLDESWQTLKQQAETHLGLQLTQEHLLAFQSLYHFLIEANQNVNLTRITALPDFQTRHVLDSLSLMPLFEEVNPCERMVDIGSGAGFPVLVLAIVNPHVKFMAIESVRKKADFITSAAKMLSLSNIEVFAQRSEDVAHDQKCREKADVITARAVADLGVLVELCLPFLRIGGRFLAMKTGTALETEIPKAKNALQKLNAMAQKPRSLDIPGLENHVIVPIVKTGPTPAKFPRKAGTPGKDPL